MITIIEDGDNIRICFADLSVKVISRETWSIIKTIIDMMTIEQQTSPLDNPENNLNLYSGSQG